MNKFNNKKVGALAGVLSLALVAAGSLAFFTDRANLSAEGKAGTVKVEHIDNLIKLTDAEGKKILNPGDQRVVKFTTENQGNKSIDVRTTLKLTSSVAMTGDTENQSEFDLYKATDVELSQDGMGYVPKTGAKPLATKTVSGDRMTITYNLPEFVLNGNSTLGNDIETETEAKGDKFVHDYVLVFKGAAGNDFQNADVKLEVLTEAKQHRNTNGTAGWTTVANDSYTFTGSDNTSADAVPVNPAANHPHAGV